MSGWRADAVCAVITERIRFEACESGTVQLTHVMALGLKATDDG